LCGSRIAARGEALKNVTEQHVIIIDPARCVAAALDAIAAGQPVAVASTRAYGCSIKYKDE
jgi:hypothetical protein